MNGKENQAIIPDGARFKYSESILKLIKMGKYECKKCGFEWEEDEVNKCPKCHVCFSIVECQNCGHRWEVQYPQPSHAKCSECSGEKYTIVSENIISK